jgi:hypothetical protein
MSKESLVTVRIAPRKTYQVPDSTNPMAPPKLYGPGESVQVTRKEADRLEALGVLETPVPEKLVKEAAEIDVSMYVGDPNTPKVTAAA